MCEKLEEVSSSRALLLSTIVREPALQRGLDRHLGWARSPRPTAVYTGLPRPHWDIKYARMCLLHVEHWGPVSPASYLRDCGAVPFPLGRALGEWEGAGSSEGVTWSMHVPPCTRHWGGDSKAGRKDFSPVELSLEWGRSRSALRTSGAVTLCWRLSHALQDLEQLLGALPTRCQ